MKRDKNGRFAKQTRYAKLLTFSIFIVAFVFVALEVVDKQLDTMIFESTHAQEIVEIIKVEDTLNKKVEDLKQSYLQELSLNCETKNVADPDGAIIFDSNNQPSIGRFQFQRETVIGYYKLLYNKEITKRDAIEIAIDPELATQLAYDIIFTDHGDKREGNWHNCSSRSDLKKQLEIIRELEK